MQRPGRKESEIRSNSKCHFVVFFFLNIFFIIWLDSGIGRSQRSLLCHCFVDIKGSCYLFLMGKRWRNRGQFQALSGRESHSIRSQQSSSIKCKPNKIFWKCCNLVAGPGKLIGLLYWDPRDNNSYVRDSVEVDVIWMSKWKAAKVAQIERHHRRLFTTTKYFPTSKGDPPGPC